MHDNAIYVTLLLAHSMHTNPHMQPPSHNNYIKGYTGPSTMPVLATHRSLPPLDVRLLAGEEAGAEPLGDPQAPLRDPRLEGVVGVGLGCPHGCQLGRPRLHLAF